MPAQRREPRPPVWNTGDPRSFPALADRFIEAMRVKNFSAHTIDNRARYLRFFFAWCEPRGLTRPNEVTLPILERYQRFLFHSRMESGKPLSVRTQFLRLQSIRAFYRWLAKGHYILSNPAADLELPRLPKKLPRHVLTISEVEGVMAVPDPGTLLGLRDRAILETLYSTGMRRAELLGLRLFDLNFDQGVVCIRCGKGKKDRVVPIGERAGAWVRKYLDEARPDLVVEPDEGAVFLACNGTPLADGSLGELVRKLVMDSGVGKAGSCHLFRHYLPSLTMSRPATVAS